MFSRGLAGVAAAVGMAALAVARGESLRVPKTAVPRLLAASLTNVFAWMGFGSIAMRWVSVSEGTLLVYTVPIWATLIEWPVRGTRPGARSVVALLLGIAGLVVLLGGGDVSLHGAQGVGAALLLAAAVLFALGAVVNGAPLPMPPLTATAWQVGLGCAPMIVVGLGFEHPALGSLTKAGFFALVYMAVVPMAICYLTWFAALRRLTAAAASTSMLLVPIIGILFATVLLGETLGLRELAAMVLTLGGVVLALQRA